MYQRIYHRPSARVQPCTSSSNILSGCTGPAYGCKGLDSLRSSPPCPWPFPCHSARTSRDTDAELKTKGKGCAPAPAATRSASRELAQQRVFLLRFKQPYLPSIRVDYKAWIFTFFLFFVWKQKKERGCSNWHTHRQGNSRMPRIFPVHGMTPEYWPYLYSSRSRISRRKFYFFSP